mmetsp:Transcript_24252/g.53885  ORF Transcript_24252/g.53885 Transcript_24252/m.53885 type:complete len:388 (+) Transcript_24252:261-1424(+)
MCRELGVSLRLESAEEHVVQRGDCLERNWHDSGHLVGLESEPNIAVAPDDQVVRLLLSSILLDGCRSRLEYLVVRVWTGGLGIQRHRHNGWPHRPHHLEDGQHVALLGRLWREEVRGVEAQAQMRDVRPLPANVAPDALGLKFTAGTFQGLDLFCIAFPCIPGEKVGAQLLHPLAQTPCIAAGLAEDIAKVGNKSARRALVPQLRVSSGDAVQELPDVAATEIQAALICRVEVILLAESPASRRAEESLDTVQKHQHVPVGHGIEAAGGADEVVFIRGYARVPKDCRQIAKHNIVVVGLGVEKPGVVPSLTASLNLRNEGVSNLYGQLRQWPSGSSYDAGGQGTGCHIVLIEVYEAFPKPHREVHQDALHLALRNHLESPQRCKASL